MKEERDDAEEVVDHAQGEPESSSEVGDEKMKVNKTVEMGLDHYEEHHSVVLQNSPFSGVQEN